MSTGNPIQLAAGLHIARKWVAQWSKHSGDRSVEYHVCGSIRREEKMIRDIDILVLDPDMHGKFERGSMFEGVELNLCFMRKECEGAGLLFLTGDYKFNIGLRSVAKKMGYKLNRYGLWNRDECIAAKTERDIFKALGVTYVPPGQRKSPDGQKGITIRSSGAKAVWYEVFITEVHGFNFCNCKGFQYRQSCKHLKEAEDK